MEWDLATIQRPGHAESAMTRPMSVPMLKGKWTFAAAKLARSDDTSRPPLQREFNALDAELRARISSVEYESLLAPKAVAVDEWPKKLHSDAIDDDFYLVRHDADKARVPSGFVAYTREDIDALKGKSREHIKSVHDARKAFPGGRLFQ